MQRTPQYHRAAFMALVGGATLVLAVQRPAVAQQPPVVAAPALPPGAAWIVPDGSSAPVSGYALTPAAPAIGPKPPNCDWESLCDPGCCAGCDDCGHATGGCLMFDWFTPGRWQFGVGAVALKRDQAEEVEFAGGYGRTLKTDSIDSPFAAMPRFMAAFAVTPFWRVEGVYYGLGEWQEDAALRDVHPNRLGGTGDLLSRLSNFGRPAVAGVDFNNFASFDTESTLDNVELSVRHRFNTPEYMEFNGLVGLRYMDIGETVQFTTASSVPGPAEATNFVDSSTCNQLFGVQIGGQTLVQVEERWFVDFEAKAAILQNEADVRTLYVNSDAAGAIGAFETSDDAARTAFVGDLALALCCQWTPRVSTRFGYRAIWIDGVAMATLNVPRSTERLRLGPAHLDTDGRAVYHGPEIGATIVW